MPVQEGNRCCPSFDRVGNDEALFTRRRHCGYVARTPNPGPPRSGRPRSPPVDRGGPPELTHCSPDKKVTSHGNPLQTHGNTSTYGEQWTATHSRDSRLQAAENQVALECSDWPLNTADNELPKQEAGKLDGFRFFEFSCPTTCFGFWLGALSGAVLSADHPDPTSGSRTRT